MDYSPHSLGFSLARFFNPLATTNISALTNLVPMAFSPTWGWGGKGKGHGNEVELRPTMLVIFWINLYNGAAEK